MADCLFNFDKECLLQNNFIVRNDILDFVDQKFSAKCLILQVKVRLQCLLVIFLQIGHKFQNGSFWLWFLEIILCLDETVVLEVKAVEEGFILKILYGISANRNPWFAIVHDRPNISVFFVVLSFPFKLEFIYL